MTLAHWLLSINYLNVFNSIKPVLHAGNSADTGDGETIKTDIDPDLRELPSLIHSVSTCCLLSLIH